jgi:hypothetical protein
MVQKKFLKTELEEMAPVVLGGSALQRMCSLAIALRRPEVRLSR